MLRSPSRSAKKRYCDGSRGQSAAQRKASPTASSPQPSRSVAHLLTARASGLVVPSLFPASRRSVRPTPPPSRSSPPLTRSRRSPLARPPPDRACSHLSPLSLLSHERRRRRRSSAVRALRRRIALLVRQAESRRASNQGQSATRDCDQSRSGDDSRRPFPRRGAGLDRSVTQRRSSGCTGCTEPSVTHLASD